MIWITNSNIYYMTITLCSIRRREAQEGHSLSRERERDRGGGGGRQPYMLSTFYKYAVKLRKVWLVGEGVAPPESAFWEWPTSAVPSCILCIMFSPYRSGMARNGFTAIKVAPADVYTILRLNLSFKLCSTENIWDSGDAKLQELNLRKNRDSKRY